VGGQTNFRKAAGLVEGNLYLSALTGSLGTKEGPCHDLLTSVRVNPIFKCCISPGRAVVPGFVSKLRGIKEVSKDAIGVDRDVSL